MCTMKNAPLSWRLALLLLLGFAVLGPNAPCAEAGQRVCAVAHAPSANLFDYIRGNRSRMVQVATIGLGIGLVILMTATRKH